MSDLFARLEEWSVGFVYSFGYLGIGFSVMIGNLHLPFPTGIVLPLAGYLIWQGRFSFVGVFLAPRRGR
jgi:membrane protein DedA with SNARE-associated domain